jgi:hypothetical protein
MGESDGGTLKHGKKQMIVPITDRLISWKEQIQFILKRSLQQVEDELSYNTTIKVKMMMNQYPLYLREETQLVLKIESITIHKKSATQISKTVWWLKYQACNQENWVLKNICLELNKHLLHIIETASLEYSRAFLYRPSRRRKGFFIKKLEWPQSISINYPTVILMQSRKSKTPME